MFFPFLLLSQNNWPDFSMMGQFFSILFMLLIVSVMAYLATKLLARSGRIKSGKRNLEVMESAGVGVQAMVQIIRAGGCYYLVGVTKERVSILAELDKDQLNLIESDKFGAETPFDKLLQRFMNRDKPESSNDRNEAQDE